LPLILAYFESTRNKRELLDEQHLNCSLGQEAKNPNTAKQINSEHLICGFMRGVLYKL